jgi:RNA polymerase sigma-70 factor, ECF subfamily
VVALFAVMADACGHEGGTTAIVALAFDDVFVGNFPRLVRALTVVCGDREVAADCVQEAFVRAHVRWDRISRMDQPVTWIRRVALNLAHDHHRRRSRAERAHLRLVGGTELEVGEPQPPSELAALLQQLPRRQREALALHYVEGLSVAEVAVSMGITDGAVKFHLHQGRERLRPLLDVTGEGR